MTDKILIDRELLESTLQCLTNLWSSDEYIDSIKEKLRAAIVAPQQEAVAWMTHEGLVIRGDIAAIVGWGGAYVGTDRAIPDSWVPFLYADRMRHNA